MTAGEVVTRPTLQKLTQEGRQIQALLLDANIEDKDTLQTALGHIEGEWLTKAENIAYLLKDLDYSVDNFDAEIEKLSSQMKTLANRRQWLADYLLANMIVKEEQSLKFSTVTVSVAKNPPSVEVIDEKLVPDMFQRLIPARYEVNKGEIIKSFKATGKVPAGCNIIADRKRLIVK